MADAAGNSLLLVDQKGTIDWVATFPEQGGVQAVPTSVAIGRTVRTTWASSREARFRRASRASANRARRRHAACGTYLACSVVITGRTAIIDLQFGPDGRLYVAQLDDAGVGAFEGGGGVGGSVHACGVTTGVCEEIVAGLPMLTAIAFRGTELWERPGRSSPRRHRLPSRLTSSR